MMFLARETNVKFFCFQAEFVNNKGETAGSDVYLIIICFSFFRLYYLPHRCPETNVLTK